MPGRATPLVNGELYHLFNRGVEKRDIFLQSREYIRFRQTFYYYQFQEPKPRFSNLSKNKLKNFRLSKETKLVEIICYCLMPNHFHFLVRQLKAKGLSIFLSQVSNSYTKYFNTKYKRVGPLFQGAFKSVRIETDEQLIHVSRYIHLNPIVAQMVKSLDDYPWSSYHEYIYGASGVCVTADVLGFFKSKERYKQFLEDQITYGITLEKAKHQLIDLV